MLFLGDDNEMFNPYYSGNGDTVYRLGDAANLLI